MKISPQVTVTLRQIMLMNFGFSDIQYSFGLQQTVVNPAFSFLHAGPGQLPILNMTGPVTGLLVQPMIGTMSGRTWVPGLDRHRPYFLIGAIGCNLCLFIYPHATTLWVAVSLLWLLDIDNSTAMKPFRAFITDTVPGHQQSTGFSMQSVLTGLGITLANVSLYIFQQIGWLQQTSKAGIPYWVFDSFYIGAVCSIGSVLVTVSSTTGREPDPEEMAAIKTQPSGPAHAVKDIVVAVCEVSTALQQLILAYLFQWYALFIYWQYISHSIVQSVWDSTVENTEAYSQAIAWIGLISGFYNVVIFISAFGLMQMARKYAAKYVHVSTVTLAALTLFTIPHIDNRYLMFAPMVDFGAGWANVIGMPFMIMVGSIPRERYGVYMDIVNMMTTIPMLIETVSFGWVYRTFLDSNPTNAATFAGVSLAIAAALTLTIRTAARPATAE